MIYLDNNATTKVDEKVLEEMLPYLKDEYANASSMYEFARKPSNALKIARAQVQDFLGAKDEKEIFFTSGGTESDNLAIIGAAMANHRAGNHLITTCIEHPAVLRTMEYLETQGFQVTYLPVDEFGRIRLQDLENALTPNTILVSIMHTNNEIGSLQPIAEAGNLIKRYNPNIVFHIDAVQGYGKFRIAPKKMGVDMMY